MTAVTLVTTSGEEFAALFGRQIRLISRTPERVLGASILPVAYVVLFGGLFGSAMKAPGGNYQNYLMAGILAQTMLSAMSMTALGISSDLSTGLVERFRSLPMSTGPIIVARTASTLALSLLSICFMTVVGLAIGWRITTDWWHAAAGFGLLLLLGAAMAWIGFLLGVTVKDAEAINSLVALVILPITFLSNAFIPLDTLPGWARVVCQWNPLSTVVTACRQLFGNPTGTVTGGWPGQHPALTSVGLLCAVLAVVIPVTLRAYRTAVAR